MQIVTITGLKFVLKRINFLEFKWNKTGGKYTIFSFEFLHITFWKILEIFFCYKNWLLSLVIRENGAIFDSKFLSMSLLYLYFAFFSILVHSQMLHFKLCVKFSSIYD